MASENRIRATYALGDPMTDNARIVSSEVCDQIRLGVIDLIEQGHITIWRSGAAAYPSIWMRVSYRDGFVCEATFKDAGYIYRGRFIGYEDPAFPDSVVRDIVNRIRLADLRWRTRARRSWPRRLWELLSGVGSPWQ